MFVELGVIEKVVSECENCAGRLEKQKPKATHSLHHSDGGTLEADLIGINEDPKRKTKRSGRVSVEDFREYGR